MVCSAVRKSIGCLHPSVELTERTRYRRVLPGKRPQKVRCRACGLFLSGHQERLLPCHRVARMRSRHSDVRYSLSRSRFPPPPEFAIDLYRDRSTGYFSDVTSGFTATGREKVGGGRSRFLTSYFTRKTAAKNSRKKSGSYLHQAESKSNF